MTEMTVLLAMPAGPGQQGYGGSSEEGEPRVGVR